MAIMYMGLLILGTGNGYSQNRQVTLVSLFDSFPTTINCTEAQLSNLFAATKGESVKLAFSDRFEISGLVTSKLVKYNNLQTIVIKLPAFRNTLFSLSKQTDQKNNYTYAGRILNPLYADGFELKHTGKGNYQLVKIDVQKILVNCNQ